MRVCPGRVAPGGWGETPAGPALRCRWAGPSAGPAALAALGSRPRRARRAGLGLRGGAGTGSGKQQCSGGGGGALPLQEPSAGRRVGAAASRDRGPRSPHGRRGGESRRRPGAAGRRARGADLPRGDAPTRTSDPLSPPPAAPPRTQTLVHCPSPASGREPPSLPRSIARAVLPGTPLLSHPREVRPSRPGAALPAHPTSSVRAFPPHASDARFYRGCTLGCAPRPAGSGRAFLQAPALRHRPCGAGAGPPCAPREPGALRGSHPAAGLDPGTARARGPARPWARNQHRAGLCSHLAYRRELALEAGGGRVRLRIGERNRQVGVYFQKRRGGAAGVRLVSARGVPVGGNLTASG